MRTGVLGSHSPRSSASPVLQACLQIPKDCLGPLVNMGGGGGVSTFLGVLQMWRPPQSTQGGRNFRVLTGFCAGPACCRQLGCGQVPLPAPDVGRCLHPLVPFGGLSLTSAVPGLRISKGSGRSVQVMLHHPRGILDPPNYFNMLPSLLPFPCTPTEGHRMVSHGRDLKAHLMPPPIMGRDTFH